MKLTKHARKRMAERGISPEEVAYMLEAKENRYVASISQEGLVKAINSEKNLTVVLEPKEQLVITVYRTNKRGKQ